MSRPMENGAILSFPRIDLGNAAANAAQIVLPCKVVLLRAVAGVSLPLANSATVRIDSIVANSRSNGAVATIVMPDSAAPGSSYYNVTNAGLVLNAGSILSLECTEAGDSGEFADVSLFVQYEPEVDANQSTLILSA